MNSRQLLTCILILWVCNAQVAYSRQLLELEEVYMTGAKLNGASRDPLAPQYTYRWEDRATLGFRFNVLGALYWDNILHTETAVGAPKTVGWHWILGMRVVPELDLIYEHHSRHLMDYPSPSDILYEDRTKDNFPVEDSYGIKLNIFTGTKGRSIWD